MRIELNHVIVPATDRWRSANFLASILGLELGAPFGPFAPFRLANGVTLDFEDTEYPELRWGSETFEPHHCAFLVDDEAFDAIFQRVQEAGVTYYADPQRKQPGELNRLFGGRGFYFDDPDGHLMEVLTWTIPDEWL